MVDDALSFLDGQTRPQREDSVGSLLRAFLNKRDAHVSQSEHPHAFASESLGCARRLALRIAGYVVGRDRDDDLAGGIAKSIGNHLHGVIQEMMAERYPDFEAEFKWDGGAVTGRGDGRYTKGGKLYVLEIKTVSEWQFKRSSGEDAPEPSHLMQALLSARAIGGDMVHLVYVRKTGRANEQQVLEWEIPYKDHAAAADAEFARLSRVVNNAADGAIADRVYQGRLLDPNPTKWPCSFCPCYNQCVAIGPGVKSNEEVERITREMGKKKRR